MPLLKILGPDGQGRLGWQSPPPTGPTDPPPDPPGSFTHGTQIFRNNIGRPGHFAGDTRTALATPTTIAGRTYTSADSNSTVTNVRFTNNVVIASGCTDITFKYCWFDGPASDLGGKYLVRNQGGRVYFEDCSVFGRYGHGKSLFQEGTGGMWFKRCYLGGSEDIIHAGSGSGGTGPQPWATVTCPDFTGARIIVDDSFMGDGVRYSSGHIDGCQFDTNGPRVGNAIFRRCKMFADSVNSPSSPPTTLGDPTNPANAVFIATHGSTPGTHGYYGIYDCQIDGGNITVNWSPPDGPAPLIMAVRGCKVGHDSTFTHGGNTCVAISRYGTGIAGTSSYRSDNTWLSTGTYALISGGATPNPTYPSITAGSPVNI